MTDFLTDPFSLQKFFGQGKQRPAPNEFASLGITLIANERMPEDTIALVSPTGQVVAAKITITFRARQGASK